MKRSVCSQLMFVILFVLQSQKLLTNSQVPEYSEQQKVYLAKSPVREQQHPHHHAHAKPYEDHNGNHLHQHHQQIYSHQLNHHHQQQHQQQQQNHPQNLQLSNDGTNNIHAQQQQHHHQLQNNQQTIHTAAHQDLGQQNQPIQYLPSNHPHQQNQHHYQYEQRLQQQQQQNTQQQHLNELYHHSSYANNMQQVLLDPTSGHSYHYAQHIGWKHETTPDGELLAIVDSYEAAYTINQPANQLSFYEYYQHQKKSHEYSTSAHIIAFSGQIHDDYIYDDNLPDETCHVQPNMWQANFQQPTCQKNPTSVVNHGTTSSSKNVPNLSQLTNKPSHNSNIESFPLTPQHYHYESSLISAIRHYWREVSGLCLASAIFLNWLFVVIKRRLVDCGLNRADHAIESIRQSTSKSVFKDTNSSSAQDSAFDETASPISLDDIESSESISDHQDKSTTSVHSTPFRQRSSTLMAEPIPIPSKSPGHNSLSTSLSNSLNTSEYSSRYSSDFDSIQRLGRGGFGIVFEARNKIDDCRYAVKRICLPLEKEARERVMREVRALAKLDHAGIVRYYNAWLETPPDEWLKQHDAQLGIVHSKDGLNFPSTDGIYERNESEHITKGSNGNSRECGDNSADLFGSSPFKRRTNGFSKYLKNNSNSASLDIVFEGSGSIRLESENNTEKTDSSKSTPRNSMLLDDNDGDNISDSEDFIQMRPKGNSKNDLNEFSHASQLSDPFSSSSDEKDDDDEEESSSSDINGKQANTKRNALVQQKGLRERHLNQSLIVENSPGEKVYLYIQMQLCRKDTLKDWLKTNCEQRDKTTIFDLFYQIVDAMEYVHSQDLIHRDLKPSNIFFSLDGTLKIGDFGLCRTKTAAQIGSSLDLQEYVAESDVERSFEAVHTEQVGTQLYMSPEQLNGLSYNQKVDIFAMGLILLELLVPFKTQMQRVNVLFKARNNLYSDEFRIDHPQEHELVKTLLSRSPSKRPTATEIKQHELLASAQLSQPVIERIYNHRRRTISSNSSTE